MEKIIFCETRFQLWSKNKRNLCFKTNWKEIDNNVESSYLHVKVSAFFLSFTFTQLQTFLKGKPIGYISFGKLEIPMKVFYTRQNDSTMISAQSFCVSRFVYLNSESNSLLNCTYLHPNTHTQINEAGQAFSEELWLSPKPPYILQMVISHMPHSLPFPWRSW